jgi:hypothetical protein
MVTKKATKEKKENSIASPTEPLLYSPIFPPIKQEVSITYDLNWVALRREIQKHNFLRFTIPKFNLWGKYCSMWNKHINRSE